ncbi:hypothetical protein S245_051974 [Arachis hypogaea]
MIISVVSRVEPILVRELEALLLSHECMLEKFKKLDLFIQENVAHFESQGQRQHHRFFNQSNFRERGRFSFCDRRGRSSGYRGGGTFSGTRTICQLCNKFGHTTV